MIKKSIRMYGSVREFDANIQTEEMTMYIDIADGSDLKRYNFSQSSRFLSLTVLISCIRSCRHHSYPIIHGFTNSKGKFLWHATGRLHKFHCRCSIFQSEAICSKRLSFLVPSRVTSHCKGKVQHFSNSKFNSAASLHGEFIALVMTS
jgi:hypothetical protein